MNCFSLEIGERIITGVRMISVQREQVPEYLKSSPYYANAFGDSEDGDACTIDVPADCFKTSTEILSESDLHMLLRTVRFWLIPESIESSSDFISYAINNKQALGQATTAFDQDFPYLSKLSNAISPPEGHSVVEQCAAIGLLSLIKYLRDSGHIWYSEPHPQFTTLAAQHGRLECLQYALEQGWNLHGQEGLTAARHGHLDCLRYAHEHGNELGLQHCFAAVGSGSLSCFQYIYDFGKVDVSGISALCNVAATVGNLALLQYLYSLGCTCTALTASNAATSNRLECLEFLHSVSCPWGTDTTQAAAHSGSIECLRFLHEHGCPWDNRLLRAMNSVSTTKLAQGWRDRQLRCFLYAAERGCPITAESFVFAITIDANELLNCLLQQNKALCGTSAYVAAIEASRYEVVNHLHNQKIAWDASVSSAAAKCGEFDILRYLLSKGCPFGTSAYVAAIEARNYEVLNHLHNQKIAWDASVSSAAAKCGEFDILRYLLSKGCPFDFSTWRVAVTGDHLGCLRCLHEHTGELDASLIKVAVHSGSIRCLRYLLSPSVTLKGSIDAYRENVMFDARSFGSRHKTVDYLQFLLENGAECGPAVCAAAAATKSYLFLRSLHKQGVQWDVSTPLAAIRSGAFDCLALAVANGCPVDAMLPAEAARLGNKLFLKWVHRNGKCPWDSRTTAAAVQSDSVDCLQYAVSNGCPYEVNAKDLAKAPHCKEYMVTEGFALLASNERTTGTKRKADELQQP